MKLRPIFKCHGGKFYLYKWILSHFPENYKDLTYIEGCGGAASVLLNKEPSKTEIYNDADPSIAGIVSWLSSEPTPFVESLSQIEYTASAFEWSKAAPEGNLVAELVRRRFSRGGLREAFAWSNRLRGGEPGDVNAWKTFLKQLPLIGERLKSVKVYCKPITDLIDLDAEDVLWYIDPPYLPSTRQSFKTYTVEMTEQDHITLAEKLNQVKGKVVLSGYQSPLYSKLYKDWNLYCRPVTNHSSQSKTKQKRIECLWTNY